MQDKFWYLKSCELFARLTPEQISRLESRARFRKFPRNSMVYLPSDQSDSVVLLTSGRVKLYNITPDGKQQVLALIDPGEIFGELSLWEEGQRDEFAETMEASTLVLLPPDAVQKLMDEHPTVAVGITRIMGLRRQRFERRLKSLLFRSNRERLISLLLELAEKYGQPTSEGILIGIKLSHQELGSIIGSTRESVTLLLNDLQAEGHVQIRHRQILLCRIEKLAASINATPPKIQPAGPIFTNPLMRQLPHQA